MAQLKRKPKKAIIIKRLPKKKLEVKAVTKSLPKTPKKILKSASLKTKPSVKSKISLIKKIKTLNPPKKISVSKPVPKSIKPKRLKQPLIQQPVALTPSIQKPLAKQTIASTSFTKSPTAQKTIATTPLKIKPENKNIVMPIRSTAEYVPVSGPQLKKNVDVDDTSLPDLSDKTNLRLLPRDPHWIHAYWKIAPQVMQEAKKNLGKTFDTAKHVLRVHDVTCIDFNGSNANHTFDVPVNPQAQSWYVDSWKDNVSYCAELGLTTDNGNFYPLAKSNFVHTPRLSFSQRGDMIWMDVKAGSQKIPFINQIKSTDKKGSMKGRRYLTEDDVRAYYARLFPLLRRVYKTRLSRFARKKMFDGSNDLEDSEFDDNDLLSSLRRNKWFRRILLGASEEMIESGALAGKAGASESVTSAGVGQSQKKREFFFELGTELIVYGRTEPNAQVWHGSKNVPLRPDGTFSLRFALADNGFIPLDFKAVSHDQIETRKILTSAQRAKTSHQTHFS